jgi:hypothetical protein
MGMILEEFKGMPNYAIIGLIQLDKQTDGNGITTGIKRLAL